MSSFLHNLMYKKCSEQQFGEGNLAACTPLFTNTCGILISPFARHSAAETPSHGTITPSETFTNAQHGEIKTVTADSDDLWSRIWASIDDAAPELSHSPSQIPAQTVNDFSRHPPNSAQESAGCAAPKDLCPPYYQSGLATHTITTTTHAEKSSLPTQEQASTCAAMPEPFSSVLHAKPSMATNPLTIATIVHSVLLTMPSEVMPTAISTKTITKTVTATGTAMKNNITSATPHPGMGAGMSSEFFDSLVGNATTVVAGKLGLDYISMEPYIPTIRRLITALVMGGTVGGALALGRSFYSSGQVRREQAGTIREQAERIGELEDDLEELEDEIEEQSAHITELEKQNIPLQNQLSMETSNRKKAEAQLHELKIATGTEIRTPSRSTPPMRPNLPLTPMEQARRKSYKDAIDANAHLLLGKEKVYADDFADQIYEQVPRTPRLSPATK
jgi:hypothetical protein